MELMPFYLFHQLTISQLKRGIYQHFNAISKSSPLPIILYNVPGRTSSNMTAETTLRLAYDFENIIAIKEASVIWSKL